MNSLRIDRVRNADISCQSISVDDLRQSLPTSFGRLPNGTLPTITALVSHLEAVPSEHAEPPPQLHRVHALAHVGVVQHLVQIVARVAPRFGVGVAYLAWRMAEALLFALRSP